MTSSLRLILGVSVLATSICGVGVGCSSSNATGGGAGAGIIVVGGGAPGTAGAGGGAPPGGGGAPPAGGGALGTAGAAVPVTGIPLDPKGGTPAGLIDPPGVGAFVDAMDPVTMLHIQGAMFPYADPTTTMGMMADFSVDGKACITGTAAKVDTASAACAPPVTDCFGALWGAAMGINLNQPNDPVTMMGGAALPFDATKLKGFSFEISGGATGLPGVPPPASLRFKVEDASGEFCTPALKKIQNGVNTVLFSELLSKCYLISTMPPNPTAETAKSALLKIGWAVVTNNKNTVPFDFCVSNIVAIPL